MNRNSNQNIYYGKTTRAIETESFNISLTVHPANSIIPKHSHKKPYLCLLASGSYNEESRNLSVIKNGYVLYRSINYEHSNQFSNEQSICLNLEINNPEQFINQNNFILPKLELEQKASINIYKLLYSFKSNVSKDVLNIYCYESFLSHFENLKVKGKLVWVKNVKEYINDNILDTISLKILSEEFQLHPNYIVRKFKEVTGCTLSEYLIKIRLEHSIRSLIQTENPLTEIALNSGFYDQSHFNKNFNKYINTKPSFFRKTIKS